MRVLSLLTALFLFFTSFVAASPISARDNVLGIVVDALDDVNGRIDKLIVELTTRTIVDGQQAIDRFAAIVLTTVNDEQKVMAAGAEDLSPLVISVDALDVKLGKLIETYDATELDQLVDFLERLPASFKSLTAIQGWLPKVRLTLQHIVGLVCQLAPGWNAIWF